MLVLKLIHLMYGYIKLTGDSMLDYAEKVKHRKMGASARGIDFDLNERDLKRIDSKQKCIATGLYFSKEHNYRRSIDRVDSSLGYSRENVVAMCVATNKFKQQFDTKLQLQKEIDDIIAKNEHLHKQIDYVQNTFTKYVAKALKARQLLSEREIGRHTVTLRNLQTNVTKNENRLRHLKGVLDNFDEITKITLFERLRRLLKSGIIV